MLCRKLNDQFLICLRQSINANDECVNFLSVCEIERGFQISRLPHVEKTRLNTDSLCTLLNIRPLRRLRAITHVQ